MNRSNLTFDLFYCQLDPYEGALLERLKKFVSVLTSEEIIFELHPVLGFSRRVEKNDLEVEWISGVDVDYFDLLMHYFLLGLLVGVRNNSASAAVISTSLILVLELLAAAFNMASFV